MILQISKIIYKRCIALHCNIFKYTYHTKQVKSELISYHETRKKLRKENWKMENHHVGATWGNPVITGHPEAKVCRMNLSDMRLRARLLNECGCVANGCDQRQCSKYVKARFLNQCRYQKFNEYCDCL